MQNDTDKKRSERPPYNKPRYGSGRPQQSPNMKLSAEDKTFLAEIYDQIRAFSNADDSVLALSPVNSYRRKLIHDLSVKFGLRSSSEGEGDTRHNVLTKTDKVVVPNIDYTKKTLWNFNREYLTKKSIAGVDVVLDNDGSVMLYNGQPKNKFMDRKTVTTGSLKIIDGKITEFHETRWK